MPCHDTKDNAGLRFHCYAINTHKKKQIGNRPVEEATKMNVIKD